MLPAFIVILLVYTNIKGNRIHALTMLLACEHGKQEYPNIILDVLKAHTGSIIMYYELLTAITHKTLHTLD